MVYAVIDTNVLVAALLSKLADSSTVVIRQHILEGTITPLFNDEIFKEYTDVLHRPLLKLPTEQIESILDAIVQRGLILGRTKTDEIFTDPKDIVFYEVALSKEGSYLVTDQHHKNPLIFSGFSFLVPLFK